MPRSDLQSALRSLVDGEFQDSRPTMAAAKKVINCFWSFESLKALEDEIGTLKLAHAESQNSLTLLHLHTTALALLGDTQSARKLVSERLVTSLSSHGKSSREFKFCSQLLKAIGEIMKLEAERKLGYSFSLYPHNSLDIIHDPGFEDLGATDHLLDLFSEESGLENQSEEKLCLAAQSAFDKNKKLNDRAKIIANLLRKNQRAPESYERRYSQALHMYELVRFEWVRRVQDIYFEWSKAPRNPVSLARTFRAYMKCAIALERHHDARILRNALVDMANSSWGHDVRYIAASALCDIDPIAYKDVARALINSTKRSKLTKSALLGDFLNWACSANELRIAAQTFTRLPNNITRTWHGRHFADLVARNGQFPRAVRILENILANLLCEKNSLSPQKWNSCLIRAGHFRRLGETEKRLEIIPQPTEPSGVVFLFANTQSGATQLPLVSLLELRKNGWAIVPLCAGAFPYEATGNDTIDRWANKFDSAFNHLAHRIQTPEEFWLPDDVVDNSGDTRDEPQSSSEEVLSIGEVRWFEMNSNEQRYTEEFALPNETRQKASLTQERTERRRWSVNEDCPIYKKTIAFNEDLERSVGDILQLVENFRLETGLKIALVPDHSHSIVGAMCTHYCNRVAEPDELFVLNVDAAAFLPFNEITNVALNSPKFVPEFPIAQSHQILPIEWETTANSDSPYDPNFQENLKTCFLPSKLSDDANTLPPGARLALRQIEDWKSKGGRVACIFCPSVLASPRIPETVFGLDVQGLIVETIASIQDTNTLLLLRRDAMENDPVFSTLINESTLNTSTLDTLANVVIVESDWFSLVDLQQIIDLGIVFEDPPFVELTALDIPTLNIGSGTASEWSNHNRKVTSLDQYRQLISFKQGIVNPAETTEDAFQWLSHRMNLDASEVVGSLKSSVLFESHTLTENLLHFMTDGFVSSSPEDTLNSLEG